MINYSVHCDFCGYRLDDESPLDIGNGYCDQCGDEICDSCKKIDNDHGIFHLDCWDEIGDEIEKQ